MRILHLFRWKLKDIIPKLLQIKEQGFNAIQLTPMQPVKDKNCGYWWIHYQPCAFQVGNELIGTKEELRELCTKANELGIKVIQDVICNHVAGADTGEVIPHEKVDKRLTKEEYLKDPSPIWDWNNRYEVINHSIGLPSLRLENYELQDIIIDFLNELIDIGISGFRFDAARHIPLPEEGSDFWTRIFENLKRKDLFNYGEVIFEKKELIDKYCKYINVLTDSFGSDKNKLVTFVESHDTYLEFKSTCKIDDELMIREYNILTDNFKNTLFYVRPYSRLWEDYRIKAINEKVKEC